MKPLREQQTELTRKQIIDAVFELLADGHPAALSIPGVSRRSGVSKATIYRYFASKEELLDAASAEGATPRQEIIDMAPDVENFAPFLTQLYGEFDVFEPRLRAQIGTRLGQDVRMRRRERQVPVIRELLEAAGFEQSPRAQPAASAVNQDPGLLGGLPRQLRSAPRRDDRGSGVGSARSRCGKSRRVGRSDSRHRLTGSDRTNHHEQGEVR